MVESRVVQARTRQVVEHRAARARVDLGLKPHDKVDMATLVDLVLPTMIDGYQMRVEFDADMGGAEAVTDLNAPIVTFSLSTYAALGRKEPRARMTAAHEIGHLLMHTRHRVSMAFLRHYDPLRDPERQADVFAAAFLMPEEAFRTVASIEAAMRKFGVSRDAATCRARKLRMGWLITGHARPATKKKGGRPMVRSP